MKRILPYILAAMMLLGALGHFIAPAEYNAMIPEFISSSLANILAGIVEGVIGVALLLPRYRKWGGLGFMFLMIAFLPIHVWDVTRDEPAIGSTIGAWIRLPLQFVFIYAGWLVSKRAA